MSLLIDSKRQRYAWGAIRFAIAPYDPAMLRTTPGSIPRPGKFFILQQKLFSAKGLAA
jgi:hypothetical protein